ncbi:hypothetical protein F511_03785 [Dorcoceras hygrometricum]|uniref:Uncharacterized protein n=1 Tax=Dorcoceras hygrometricum TaxID=472368 RepID=A0A2Z7BB26_9LAMI|nr:hypothetical protein F511_03785 [Dorcoceras hygrometricum]
MTKHVEMQAVTQVEKKKKKPAVEKKKKKEKVKKVVEQPSVEAEGQNFPTKSKSWTRPDEDSCTQAGLKELRAKHKQVVESPDSEAIELREISRQHRDLRVLAGLPIVASEASIVGDAVSIDTLQITLPQPTQPRIPALEFSTQTEQEKLVELVNHLKETGDAKKEEGGQIRGFEGGQGPSRQGEGPINTKGKGPKYERGDG